MREQGQDEYEYNSYGRDARGGRFYGVIPAL